MSKSTWFNDTHADKLHFTQFITTVAASDLFHMFTQSIKFYMIYYHVLKSADL